MKRAPVQKSGRSSAFIPIIIILLLVFLALAFLLFRAGAINAERDQANRTASASAELAAEQIPATATPVPTELPTLTQSPAPTEIELPSPTPQKPTASPAEWREWPILPESVSDSVKALYFEGIAEGNDPNKFSKIGDSNTVLPSFLACFDGGETGYALGDYAALQETISHFQWSFSRDSRGARNGATAYDLDVYHWYEDDICWPYESATTCEYRLNKPSIAFISVGTNDAFLDISLFDTHLRSLVQKTLDRKIVPILTTKADNTEGDNSFNERIAQIASDFDIPLWNLWRAMSALPNNGLREGDVHPTFNETSLCNFAGSDLKTYGWTVRNLSGLQALDRVWRLLNDETQ